jgi:hypothetical protein
MLCVKGQNRIDFFYALLILTWIAHGYNVCMEIVVDPKDEKKFKLVKKSANLVWLILVIFVAGIALAVLAKNALMAVPFLIAEGLLYAFSGNSFEVFADTAAGTIVRSSHDMLHLVQYHTAVKIEDVHKICVIGRYSGSRHVNDRLVILAKDQARTTLCTASFGPDCDKLLRFSHVLAHVVEKDFDTFREEE